MITKKINYNANNLKKNKIVLYIETTGLSSLYDKLVVLGLITYEDNTTYIIQYFAEDDSEEVRLLNLFLKKTKDKEIITYNGDTFDLPFLNTRLEINKLESNILYKTMDIYKIVRSKRHFINFDSMKLMDIEKLVNIERNDPSRYKTISKLTEEIKIRDNPKPILIHNQNDIIATEQLMNIENIIKEKLSIRYKDYSFYLINAHISNDVAKISLESSKELIDSYFTNSNYQLQTKSNIVTIYFTVIYGKIHPSLGGYVTRNIFNIISDSDYRINPALLSIKEGKMYNCKNILNHSLKIIKENLIL